MDTEARPGVGDHVADILDVVLKESGGSSAGGRSDGGDGLETETTRLLPPSPYSPPQPVAVWS